MPLGTTFDRPETAWQVQGEGDPLVLIAGLASDQNSWGGFERHLAASARVVTFDHRGIGQTPAIAGPYTMPALASDLMQMLDKLELERPHVLGVSMGGMVALEFAVRYPDRVRSLVLGCTHPGGKLQIRPTQQVLDKLPSLGKTTEAMVTDFLSMTHSARFLAQHPDESERLLRHRNESNFSRRTYVLQLGAILAHDVCSRLTEIRAPTLVISGDDDQFVPLANAVLLAERIRDAELCVLHDIGHAFWLEAPERAAHEVLRFLARSSIARPASAP